MVWQHIVLPEYSGLTDADVSTRRPALLHGAIDDDAHGCIRPLRPEHPRDDRIGGACRNDARLVVIASRRLTTRDQSRSETDGIGSQRECRGNTSTIANT